MAVAGVILAVILVNVLLRVASLPDLPGWVDAGADVIHTILKVKKWLVAGVIVVVIAGLAMEAFAKSRGGAKSE